MIFGVSGALALFKKKLLEFLRKRQSFNKNRKRGLRLTLEQLLSYSFRTYDCQNGYEMGLLLYLQQ